MHIVFEDIPLHVLSNILSNILESGTSNGKKESQVSAMRVSSSFFLASIPHVYRDVKINGIEEFESFVLHKSIYPSTKLDRLSVAQLLRKGHTKLAALRHVRRLYLSFPPPSPTVVTYPLSALHNQHHQAIRQQEETKQDAMLLSAEKSLQDLPRGIMPNLRDIQIGDLVIYHEAQPGTRIKVMAGMLLNLITPQVWCQHFGGRVTIRTPPTPTSQLAINQLPTFHRHVRPFGGFSLVVGSLNYIYIHRKPLVQRESSTSRILGRTCGTGAYRGPDEYDPEALTAWLEGEIKESFRAFVRGRVNPQTQALISKTRVIFIGGAAPTSPTYIERGQGLFPRGEGIVDSQGIIQKVRKTIMDGEYKTYLKGIEIEAKRAEEMPACPICGAILVSERGQSGCIR